MSQVTSPIIIKTITEESINVDTTYFDPDALRHDLYRSLSPMGNNPLRQGVKVGSDIDPEQTFIDTSVEPNNTYYYQLVSSRIYQGEPEFQFVIQTDIVGQTANNQFQLTGAEGNYHLQGESLEGPETISLQNVSGDEIIVFPVTGLWRLWLMPTVVGGFHRVQFNNGGDAKKLLAIEEWGAAVHWSTMERAFYGCDNLTIMPEGLIFNLHGVTNFSYCFANTNWNAWDSLIFTLGGSITDFSYCFAYNNMTTIPEGIFENCTSVQNFEGCFFGNDFQTLPGGLFQSCTSVISFESCFSGNQLTSLPSNLFQSCTLVQTFESCFMYNLLTEVPLLLFENCTLVQNFNSCFADNSIQELALIFESCSQVQTFDSCFANNLLTAVPTGLFGVCSEVLTFNSCFLNNNVTNIPDNLFDICTQVTDFGFCFAGNGGINYCSPELFQYNTLANFPFVFEGSVLDVSNYSDMLINLNTYHTSNLSKTFHAGAETLFMGEATVIARSNLVAPTGEGGLGWTIIDGGMVAEYFTFTINTALTNSFASWDQGQFMVRATGDYDLEAESIDDPGAPIEHYNDLTTGNTIITLPFLGNWRLTIKPKEVNGFNRIEWGGVSYGGEEVTSIEHWGSQVFWGTTFFRAFMGCKNIASLPSTPIFNVENVTSFGSAFNSCWELSSIPSSLFKNASSANSFVSTFRGCYNLQEIPEGIFDLPHLTVSAAATSLESTFMDCRSISTIPVNTFQHFGSTVTNVRSLFNGCWSLITLPAGILDSLTHLSNLHTFFNECRSLMELPPKLFNNSQGSYFGSNNLFNCGTDPLHAPPITWIPENLFEGMHPSTNSIANCFQNWRNLVTLPLGLFDYTPNISTLNSFLAYTGPNLDLTTGFFEGRTTISNITGILLGSEIPHIPNNLFRDCTNLQTVTSAFNGSHIQTVGTGVFKNCTSISGTSLICSNCLSLQTVSDDFFEDSQTISNYDRVFSNTPSLLTPPRGPFINKPNLGSISAMFEGSGIQTIPVDLFYNMNRGVNTTSAARLFNGCSQLQSIPQGLFGDPLNPVPIDGLSQGFQDCIALSTLPGGMFKGVAPTFNNLFATFLGCSGITTLPSDLFEGLSEVTALSRTFLGASSITEIPEGFLDPLIGLIEVIQCFEDCTSLQTIPATLFNNCDILRSFQNTFRNTGITAIPVGLFSNMAPRQQGEFHSFDGTFRNCVNLNSIPPKLFDTPFAEVTINFQNTFTECGSISSVAPDLWQEITVPSSFADVFWDTTLSVTDYSNILINLADYQTRTNRFWSATPNQSSGQAASNARDYLTNTLGWTIVDSGHI